MKKEIRTIVYDEDLCIEAYSLEGIVQAFPNHFHECYVIGFMVSGQRLMTCKHQEYSLRQDDIIIFHPFDNHACQHIGEAPLDYRAFNIPQSTMMDLVYQMTGHRELPGFSQNVIIDEDILNELKNLHSMVMEESSEFEKEESLILLIRTLLQKYGQSFHEIELEYNQEVEQVCMFIRKHYHEHLSLKQLCQHVGLSESSLLRAFTKCTGVTPYRYLESLRINEAKKLLEQGLTPLEVALDTGFSDQSHFTKFFSRFTGIAPGLYRDIFVKGDKS